MPGLLRAVGRTAVVAGTATAVADASSAARPTSTPSATRMPPPSAPRRTSRRWVSSRSTHRRRRRAPAHRRRPTSRRSSSTHPRPGAARRAVPGRRDQPAASSWRAARRGHPDRGRVRGPEGQAPRRSGRTRRRGWASPPPPPAHRLTDDAPPSATVAVAPGAVGETAPASPSAGRSMTRPPTSRVARDCPGWPWWRSSRGRWCWCWPVPGRPQASSARLPTVKWTSPTTCPRTRLWRWRTTWALSSAAATWRLRMQAARVRCRSRFGGSTRPNPRGCRGPDRRARQGVATVPRSMTSADLSRASVSRHGLTEAIALRAFLFFQGVPRSPIMLPNRHLHVSFVRGECLEEAFTFHQLPPIHAAVPRAAPPIDRVNLLL